jgi:prepilin-type N-terminal cleavage/methylation domain-containing protein
MNAPSHLTRAAVDRAPRAQSPRAGFTLIEVLAVIVILGILMIVLLPRLTEMMRRSDTRITATNIQLMASAIKEYETRAGDYPPSQFLEKWGSAPNLTNMGSETLVIALWSEGVPDPGVSQELLGNSDGDETKKHLTTFGTNALFELKDNWGHPIAYFHHRDYGRTDTYVLDSEAGEVEMQVKAQLDPLTKSYYEPHGFQLISAGEDGKFGTEDDVTNFKAR